MKLQGYIDEAAVLARGHVVQFQLSEGESEHEHEPDGSTVRADQYERDQRTNAGLPRQIQLGLKVIW